METIKPGSAGIYVSACQMALRALRFTGADGQLPKVDGVFGRNTSHAVIEFQKYYKAQGQYSGDVDGIFGPKCWDVIGL